MDLGTFRADPRNRYAAGAAAVLLLGILHEIVRLFFVPWPNIPFVHSAGIAAILIVVWSLAIVALLGRRRSSGFASAAWLASFIAVFTMAAHGIISHVLTGSYVGLLYLSGALLLVFLLKRTWEGSEIRLLRRL